jgi:hypothetical protein
MPFSPFSLRVEITDNQAYRDDYGATMALSRAATAFRSGVLFVRPPHQNAIIYQNDAE